MVLNFAEQTEAVLSPWYGRSCLADKFFYYKCVKIEANTRSRCLLYGKLPVTETCSTLILLPKQPHGFISFGDLLTIDCEALSNPKFRLVNIVPFITFDAVPLPTTFVDTLPLLMLSHPLPTRMGHRSRTFLAYHPQNLHRPHCHHHHHYFLHPC